MRLLVLHALQRPARQTTVDHVLAFERHLPGVEVVYHHLRQPGLHDAVSRPFDLTVLSHCLLSHRTTKFWDEHLSRLASVRDRLGTLVALPQDDYKVSERLDEGFDRLRVDRVFTPLDRGLERIYPRTIERVPMVHVLTGYVEPTRLTEDALPLADRPLDLGTRVRNLPEHYGRHGQQKAHQAQALAEAARKRGFRVDVSTRAEDVLAGPDWGRFLRSCRFTLGSKGGASIIDRDGSLRTAVEKYRARRPDATYEEVRNACFPEAEEVPMTAISPRLFEAAASGTCQILTRDRYLNLEAEEHYIALEPDLSNVEEVVERLADVDRAQSMASQARRALLDEPEYGYPAFVRRVVEESLGESPPDPTSEGARRGRPRVALEASRRRLGEELFECFRIALLSAHRVEGVEDLENLFDAVHRWSDEHRELVEQLLRQHLDELLPATERLGGGLRSACVEVARLCCLEGAHEDCKLWFRTYRNGQLNEQALWPWMSAELAQRQSEDDVETSSVSARADFDARVLRAELLGDAAGVLSCARSAGDDSAGAAYLVGAFQSIGDRAAALSACRQAEELARREGRPLRSLSAGLMAERLGSTTIWSVFASSVHRAASKLSASSAKRWPGVWRLTRWLRAPIGRRPRRGERQRLAVGLREAGASFLSEHADSADASRG